MTLGLHVGSAFLWDRSKFFVIHAVLWDVDGTLIDSEPLNRRCFHDICAAFGRPVREDEKSKLFARSFPEVWDILSENYTFPVSYTAWCQAFVDRYKSLSNNGAARTGVIETVRRLTAMRVPQACVSNNMRKLTEINLDIVGVRDAMAFLVCLEDVNRGKPDPESYLKACARLKLEPGQCLAVDDSPVGVAAAKAAGLYTVAFPGTSQDAPDFDFATHAQMVVHSMDAFPWSLMAHEHRTN
jgi:HAD superfamily hydrolase (TIGR01509 family)